MGFDLETDGSGKSVQLIAQLDAEGQAPVLSAYEVNNDGIVNWVVWC